MNNKKVWLTMAFISCFAVIGWAKLPSPNISTATANSENTAGPAKIAESAAKFILPGMKETDGSEHKIHTPNRVKGKTINVTKFGANPKNNFHDDTAAIQKAINSATYGDEVYFPNGTYNLKSTISGDPTTNIKLKSGVNLRGQSQHGVILVSYFTKKDNFNSKVMNATGKNNILLSNLIITSTFKGKYSTNSTQRNPDHSGPKFGINIDDHKGKASYNITIDHILVEKFESIAVRISNSHDIVVKNSTFKNATDVAGGGAGYGVSIQGSAKKNRLGYDNDTRFNFIENSHFVGPYLRHGALIEYYAHNNVIRGSTFTNTVLNAIDLHGEDEYLNEIVDNNIRGVHHEAGIGVGNIGGTAPYNHDASGPGNYIHGNTISDSYEGIRVYMGSPDTVIEDNTITRAYGPNSKGIHLLNAPGTIVKNNRIFNNTAAKFWTIVLSHDPGDRKAGNAGQGDPQEIKIIGNKIYGNSNGVLLETGSSIIMQDNHIQGNRNTNLNNNLKDLYSSIQYVAENES